MRQRKAYPMGGEGQLVLVASLPEGQVPEAFQVFPAGVVEIEGGNPFLVDDPAMQEVLRSFEDRGLDMVVDYEHQTEGGEWSSPDGTAPAAGWITSLEARGADGIWAVVNWTDRAKALIASREYRYFSPVFSVGKENSRLVELLRVALTNSPRLNGIRPLVAKEGGQERSPKEKTKMDFLRLCAKQLGLPEDSTEDQVIAAMKTRPTTVQVVAKSILRALDLQESATESEVVASIHAIKQRPDLTQEVAALKNRLAARDRDDLVASALKEGKISPAQKEWAEGYALADPEGFKVFVAKAPVVVPLGDTRTSDPATGADEVTQQVAKMFGLTDDDLKKYGGK